MIKISLFLLCWNEEAYIQKTIEYYKNRFSNIKITILDNYSTDNSIKIAKQYGAEIIQWGYKDKVILPHKKLEDNPHNYAWKNECENTWILTCDMDELLDINLKQLEKEDNLGTTIINTNGYEVIGNSQKSDLSDISFYDLDKGLYDTQYLSKRILFKKGPIKEINYGNGQHQCNPIGNIIYSKNIYMIYHVKWMGLEYYKNRFLEYRKRFKNHYQENDQQIIERFIAVISNKNIQTIPKLTYITFKI